MCYCNQNVRTPFCDSFICKTELKRSKKEEGKAESNNVGSDFKQLLLQLEQLLNDANAVFKVNTYPQIKYPPEEVLINAITILTKENEMLLKTIYELRIEIRNYKIKEYERTNGANIDIDFKNKEGLERLIKKIFENGGR